jgi:hypothetical protein
LKGYARKSDRAIADDIGRTTSWVQERMIGKRECKVSDLVVFGRYFGVDPGRLLDSGESTGFGSTTRSLPEAA